VQAAVQALAMAAQGRRVAFLGDMLELGPQAARLHEETGASVAGSLDVVIGVGAQSAALIKGAGKAGLKQEALHWFADAAAAAAAAPEIVKPGDAVLVKGSRGVRMEQVAEALVARFGRREA